jgi:competence protein ComEA
MRNLKRLLVFSLAMALMVVFVPGLMAGEVEKGCEDIVKINVNKASVKELTQLKRIGPKYAERIVQYREKHGAFERVEDIKKVPGIGPMTLDANKDIITVE